MTTIRVDKRVDAVVSSVFLKTQELGRDRFRLPVLVECHVQWNPECETQKVLNKSVESQLRGLGYFCDVKKNGVAVFAIPTPKEISDFKDEFNRNGSW
jgi:hypothetical protein